MSTSKTPECVLTDALAVLQEVKGRHEAARRLAEAARRDETDAVNRVNEAQKAVDAAYEAVRKSASWGSDWHSRSIRRTEAPA